MKAAMLRKFNEIAIEEVPKPVLGPEEALIKVKYIGICGSDVHLYMGHYATAKLPVILGHEFVGTLEEINTTKEVDFKIGENVTAQPFWSCGLCDPCIEGRDNVCAKLKVFGFQEHGCFAEYIRVPVAKIYKIPSNVDLKLAALIEPLAVAVHDVKRSELKVGQTAFIIGGGPIGILIAMIARLSGASKIIISEINEYRIKFAEALGFEVMNPKKVNIESEALKITNGKGFNVIYEVSGTKQGAELMTKIVKIGGTIIVIGMASDKYPIDTGSFMAKELKMQGVRIHSQLNFATAVDIMKAGVLNGELSKFITNEFNLTDVNEAMKFSINNQEHVKVLLKI